MPGHPTCYSYILKGELSHKDSMGNYESLPRGCVQYMSAGNGVVHSEMNDGAETCRFMQVRGNASLCVGGGGWGRPGEGCTKLTLQ